MASALAMSSSAIVVGSVDTVYVLGFDLDHLLATTSADTGFQEHSLPVWAALSTSDGIGQTVAIHEATPQWLLLAAGSNSLPQQHLYKVNVSDSGAVNTARVTKIATIVDTINVTQLASPFQPTVGVAIGSGFTAFAAADLTTGLGQIRTTAFCDPGSALQRVTADDTAVICRQCPGTQTSLGGRSMRCVDCQQQFAVGTADAPDDPSGTVQRVCPPAGAEVVNDAGVNFTTSVADDAGSALKHAHQYRLTVHGTSMSGVVGSRSSSDFVVDYTVQYLMNRSQVVSRLC